MYEWEKQVLKIAYLIDTIEIDTAGTEKQLLEVIRRLDKSVFEPSLICLWESDWMKKTGHLPCDAYILGYRGMLKSNLWTVINRLSKSLDRIHVQILQTFLKILFLLAGSGFRSAVPSLFCFQAGVTSVLSMLVPGIIPFIRWPFRS